MGCEGLFCLLRERQTLTHPSKEEGCVSVSPGLQRATFRCSREGRESLRESLQPSLLAKVSFVKEERVVRRDPLASVFSFE